jgi:hypothetical protein
MKKSWVLVLAFVCVLSAGIFANMDEKGMDGGMMWMKADVKVENTADGVKIMVASKDAKEIKMIQDNTAKMVEMREKMMSGKGMGMDGMRGMMMNPDMMHMMQKKIGIVFGFLMIIWSLIIVLISATIILVIKKIMAK